MKKLTFYILIAIFILNATAQEKKSKFIDIDAFYGVVLEHDKSLATAIQGNPFGFIAAYNVKNTVKNDWLMYYNYPDFGFSVLYQNTNSSILGEMYGAYTHYNFYLNNRKSINKLQFRVAFGLGYIINPFDEITNEFNYTLSTKIAGTAYFKLNYHREFLKGKIGLNTGLLLLHFSNAGFKNPNLGINTLAATIGLNYNLQAEKSFFLTKEKTPKVISKLCYNFIFRTGINESKIPNSGQFPFYVGTFLVDKKLNYKSSLTAGVDFFKSEFLNNYLQKIEVEETGKISNKQFKTNRIGIFVGHELYVHNFSVVSQVGYNVYYPNKYVSPIYERFGFKHQFNDHFFTELTLKINLFRAEGLEFGIGYRL